MSEQYLTIQQTGNYTNTIKKSRFITHLARIKDEDDAKAVIAQVSKENAKATHNVFAYVLGDTNQIQRASDNGEPSGTAGAPTLVTLAALNLVLADSSGRMQAMPTRRSKPSALWRASNKKL